MKSFSLRAHRRWLTLLASAMLVGSLGLQSASAAKPPPTPAAPTFVDYAQCANGQPPSLSLACPDGWLNGILQATNSHYTEDQVTPQRAEVNVPVGATTSHTLTFTYQARKGSAATHAYDSLATWNFTQRSADRCQALAATDCPGGNFSAFPIPDDPQQLAPFSAPSNNITTGHMLPASTQADCNAYAPNISTPASGTYPSRCLIMYGGTITGMTAPVHDCVVANACADASVDDYASVTVTYTVSAFPAKVQLLFGGHLALGSSGGSRTWGLGHGASNINGGPYHIKWTASDEASIGNRDNQIMGSAIIFVDTTSGTQVRNTNGTSDTTDDTNIADGGSVAIGTGVYDTVSLTGGSTAGGTVSYYYQKQTANDVTPNCSSGTLIGAAVTVTNGVAPASATVSFTSAGTYEFWAVYSGDSTHGGSTSTCGSETVVVTPNTTTTATQVKNTLGTSSLLDDTNISDGGSVAIGTVIYDTATLSGNTSDAGGTVSYYYQKQTANDATPNCSSGTLIGAAVTVASGVVPASATVSFTSAGTYEFWAVYSGDGNNGTSTSTCGSETVVVSPNSNGISTNQSLVPNDSATLTSLTSGAGGTITFKLFPPSNSTCSTAPGAIAPVVDQTITVSGGTSLYTTTNSAAVTAEGTYRWLVTYTGDANNGGATSACGVEIFTVDNDTTN
jgi:hypothetical protein